MNVLVADAWPLIFLAKLDRLNLIHGVFPGKVLVPASVQRELGQDTMPLQEQRRVMDFLGHCRIEAVRGARFKGSALSVADRHVLALAAQHPKSVVLTDDSLVRRVALAEGLCVAGTLGVLIRAVRAKLVSSTEAIRALDELVSRHQFRISVDLYQESLRQMRQDV